MSYAGLVPSVHASGGNTRYGRLTKRGSRLLRNVAIQTAYRQAMYGTTLGTYYRDLKSRKNARVAAAATARKLLAVVWRILTDRRGFEALPPHRISRNSSPSGALANLDRERALSLTVSPVKTI